MRREREGMLTEGSEGQATSEGQLQGEEGNAACAYEADQYARDCEVEMAGAGEGRQGRLLPETEPASFLYFGHGPWTEL